MKKRVLSAIIAMSMICSCFVFAASAADTRYEGITYLQSAEDMLKSLNDDSQDTTLWDNADRANQQAVIDNAADAFSSDFPSTVDTTVANKWANYCARVLSRDTDNIGNRDGYVIYYLKMLDIYKYKEGGGTLSDPGLIAAYDDFKAQHEAINVAGLSLATSLASLEDYTDNMLYAISHNQAALDGYTLSTEKQTEYILKATKTLYQIFFAKTYTGLDAAFNTGFLGDDEGKKLIAVIYGKALTTELALDNIMDVLVDYVNSNFAETRDELAKTIKEIYGDKTEKAIFDFLENTLVNAYISSNASEETKADIKMLFGDPDTTDDKGALQLMFETMESGKMPFEGADPEKPEYGMINIWFNLFLRQHTQLTVSGQKATTLETGLVVDDSNRVLLTDEAYVTFGIENLDRYGITVTGEFLNLGSDWLTVKVYNEDHTPNTYVTYSMGKFNVEVDPAKNSDDIYYGYVQFLRNDGKYIETYPVRIRNAKKSSGSPAKPSTTKPEYTLKVDLGDDTTVLGSGYLKGDVITLDGLVPKKDGYLFEGFFLDEACTMPINEIKIDGHTTIYTLWVEDNGFAGGYHKVPELLYTENHFAYVLGYPDGTVRPENNITRAEVTSIFFRLLKEDVRETNLTVDNAFNDVNDGDWFNTAVSTLAHLDIINGRTADEFQPNAPITRAEFATICARFEDTDYLATNSFSDISGHWAESYINEAAARGWIKGYEDDTFRPDRLITRAETMTLVNRVLQRAPENEEDLLENMIKWSDNAEDAWYYIPVQEATNSHTYTKKNNVYESWKTIEQTTDWTKYEK